MKTRSKELDAVIQELKDTWDYTTEELADIREKIKLFVWNCITDNDFLNLFIKCDYTLYCKSLYPNMVILEGFRLLEFGEMMKAGDKFWSANDTWVEMRPPFECFSESFRPVIRKK